MPRIRRIALAASLAWAGLVAARAAPDGPSLQRQANAGTVGIISGGVDGTYIRIAADLASVLDSDHLRVLPIIGKGSLQNLADILYLRGVDIGIVQSDALAYAERHHLFPGITQTIQYITKLYDEEIHILARKDIGTLQDLAGKTVNVDVRGSGSAMTASLLFDALGIAARPTNDDQNVALHALEQGKIAALIYVAGKPARLFSDIKPGTGLHFLSVPITPTLLETYLPAQLGHADYPALIPQGAPVNTIAVGDVMAVYAWTPGSARYAKVARFVDAFFSNFPSFLKPPRHPKWREVNLAATLPGWTRFPAAAEWLAQHAASPADPATQNDFNTFLAKRGDAATLTDAQKTALFQQFLSWQAREHAPR